MPAEFDIIRRYFCRNNLAAHPEILLGPGDDAALLAGKAVPADSDVVLSTDMLVASVHFPVDTAPADIGHKALAVNLSDMAAMGAQPAWFMLSMALPEPDEVWLEDFARGLFNLADQFSVPLIGGDTTQAEQLTINITIAGYRPSQTVMRRDAAGEGDDLWVSGQLGGAAAALRDLQSGRAVAQDWRARLDRPEPRVTLGIALQPVAKAAIDLSDGLLADVTHIAQASGKDISIELPLLPLEPGLTAADLELAVTGGDDYELCFTAAISDRDRVASIADELDIPCKRIGYVQAPAARKPKVRCLREDGTQQHFGRQGYEHFAGAVK